MNIYRKHNTTIELAKELIGEFINLLFGNVWTKVGLSFLLFVLGLVLIMSPLVGQDDKPLNKPSFFYIIGSALIVISVGLIVKRWTELKRKNNR
jgi:putative Mn2+ efflux pump MntP